MIQPPSAFGVSTRGSRRIVFAIVAALVLAGCSPSATTGSTGSTTPPVSTSIPTTASFVPTTGSAQNSTLPAAVVLDPPAAYQTELGNLGKDGIRSKDSALALFAMTYGPLPGVSAPPTPGGILSGTPAIAAVRAHWSELTKAQQDAVEKYLAPRGQQWEIRPDGTVQEIQPTPQTRHSFRGAGPVALAAGPDLSAMVKAAEAQIKSKLGIEPPPIRMTIFDPDANKDGSVPLASTDCQYLANALAWCTFAFSDRIRGMDQLSLQGTVVHEVFHAFQAALGKTATANAGVPAWVSEGTAEWVESDLVGDPVNTGWWKIYLTTPRRDLFRRTYDAMGFWAHLKQQGTDPWTLFPRLFSQATASSGSYYAVTGADAMLDTWGSSFAREPARGGAWDVTGNAIPDGVRGPAEPVTVDNLHPDGPPMANDGLGVSLWQITAGTDILAFTVRSGHVRVSDGAAIDTVAPGEYCVRSGGCTCPQGSVGTPPPPIGQQILVALSGPTAAAVAGESLDSYCKKKQKPTPTPTPAAPKMPTGNYDATLAYKHAVGPDGTVYEQMVYAAMQENKLSLPVSIKGSTLSWQWSTLLAFKAPLSGRTGDWHGGAIGIWVNCPAVYNVTLKGKAGGTLTGELHIAAASGASASCYFTDSWWTITLTPHK